MPLWGLENELKPTRDSLRLNISDFDSRKGMTNSKEWHDRCSPRIKGQGNKCLMMHAPI